MSQPEPKKKSEPHIAPRKIPMQARSKERVERILDAASQLLQEEGYNAVKTNLIAKRAEVSIGSVYQFFPNRFAIFNALSTRYRERYSATLAEFMGPDSPERPWDEMLPDLVDVLAKMWRSNWAFHSVWLAIQNTAELRESDQDYRDSLIRSIMIGFLQDVLPHHDQQQLETIARTMFETSNLMLDQSMRNGEKQDDRMIDELKFLLHSYLTGHIRSTEALNREMD